MAGRLCSRAWAVSLLLTTVGTFGLRGPETVEASADCRKPTLDNLNIPGADVDVFTGFVQSMDADGIRVRVMRWYHGDGAAPFVALSPDSVYASRYDPERVRKMRVGENYLVSAVDGASFLCGITAPLDTARARALVIELEALPGEPRTFHLPDTSTEAPHAETWLSRARSIIGWLASAARSFISLVDARP